LNEGFLTVFPILNGAKDPATDLWTLLLGSPMGTTSHHVADMISPAAPVFADARANMVTQIAFLHTPLKQKQIAFGLHTNPSVAPKFPPFSKLFGAGASKGASI
jgi:hypothetical protein